MDVSPINVQLDEFRRDLRTIDRKLPRVVSKAHRNMAKPVALEARSAMAASPWRALRSHAVKGIRWSGTQKAASIRLKAGTGAIAQERGTRYHRLWGRRVRASTMRRRVFPAWVGNRWDIGDNATVAQFGKGGYRVAPTIAKHLPTIADRYLDYLIEAFDEAYPKGG